MEKKGIKELKELVVFFCRFANGLERALADGSFSVLDSTLFVGTLTSLPDAFSGITEIPGEFKDLDPEEKDELSQLITEEFDIASDAVEEVVEEIINSALNFFISYKKVSTFIKKK